jgi:hypothetical protein
MTEQHFPVSIHALLVYGGRDEDADGLFVPVGLWVGRTARFAGHFTESLILAQDERWRRA